MKVGQPLLAVRVGFLSNLRGTARSGCPTGPKVIEMRRFSLHAKVARRRCFYSCLASAVAAFLLTLLPRSLPASSAAARTDAARIDSGAVHFDSNGFNLDAFLAKPAGGGAHPAVLVIHDNFGLNDSIRDIAKEFAAAGFVALAPDFTSRLGGTRTPEQMAQAVGQLSPNVSVEDARSALAYLRKDADVDAAKISTVGFGWGGWRSFSLAVSSPDLYRAVIYCGATPSQSLDGAHAAVLAHYAQFDFRATGNAPLTEKTMMDAGKKFTYYVYPKVNRGFYAPGAQYDAEAAKLAWNRTIDFLK
jgi:carboxymethylenebutenolidase